MKTDREIAAALLPLALGAMRQAARLLGSDPVSAQEHLSNAIEKVSSAVDHLREPV